MTNPGKRSAIWVDLTGDDDNENQPPAKQARVTVNQPSRSQPRPSQTLNSRHEPGGVHLNEEDDIVDLSQDVDEGFDWAFVGAIDAKIVGIRYYNGYATPGEQVMIRREPENQYDSNAIRINNVQGFQIGHIPRILAAKLAPYLVSNAVIFHSSGLPPIIYTLLSFESFYRKTLLKPMLGLKINRSRRSSGRRKESL